MLFVENLPKGLVQMVNHSLSVVDAAWASHLALTEPYKAAYTDKYCGAAVTGLSCNEINWPHLVAVLPKEVHR